MAYDINLADRIRRSLNERKTAYTEKTMFGGLCFMVDDKMCIGIVKDDFMARVDAEKGIGWEGEEGCRPMDFTGKRMKGYYYISPEGIDSEDDLSKWVDRCLEFNPIAKSSKRR